MKILLIAAWTLTAASAAAAGGDVRFAAADVAQGQAAVDDFSGACQMNNLDVRKACARVQSLAVLAPLKSVCESSDEASLDRTCASLVAPPNAAAPACRGRSCPVRNSALLILLWTAARGTPEKLSAARDALIAAYGGGRAALLLSEALVSAVHEGQDSNRFCAAASFWSGKEPCREVMAALDGAPGACRGREAAFCREEAALVAALRTKGSQPCRNSPFCSALETRDPAACAPYRTSWRRAFCVETVRTRADLRARLGSQKREYREGEPMQAVPPEVQRTMKAIERAEDPNAVKNGGDNGGKQ